MPVPPYDARLVSNLLLDAAEAQGGRVTNLALNKLLYFAHGMYLARTGRRLIRNSFEAWQYGPVVPAVYEYFKACGSEPIKGRAKKFSPLTNEFVEFDDAVAREDAEFIQRVWKSLGRFTASDLVGLSHERGSPWHRLWMDSDLVVRPGMIIRDSEILEHFASEQLA